MKRISEITSSTRAAKNEWGERPKNPQKPFISSGRVHPIVAETLSYAYFAGELTEEEMLVQLAMWSYFAPMLLRNGTKFTPMHHKAWRKVVDGPNKWHRTNLIALELLECYDFYIQPHDGEAGECKMYRLPKELRDESQWYYVSFIRQEDRKPRVSRKSRERRRVVDTPEGHFTAQNLDKLRVKAGVDWQAIKRKNPQAHAILTRFNGRNTRVSRKRADGRMFHDFLSLPRDMRSLLEWEDGSPLVDVDVNQCFFQLYLKKCPASERQSYQTYVQCCDIYNELGGVRYLVDGSVNDQHRDEVKKQAYQFLIGGIKNDFYQAFAAKWPLLAGIIIGSNKTGSQRALELQREEASLVVDGVIGTYARSSKAVSVFSSHDGWVTTRADAAEVKEHFITVCKQTFGCALEVREKSLKPVNWEEVKEEERIKGPYTGHVGPVSPHVLLYRPNEPFPPDFCQWRKDKQRLYFIQRATFRKHLANVAVLNTPWEVVYVDCGDTL